MLTHLRTGVGDDIGIRGRKGSLVVAWMREEVGRASQQLDPRFLLFLLQVLRNVVQVGVCFYQRTALRGDITVMKRVVRYSESLKELEGSVNTAMRDVEVFVAGVMVPGAVR